MIELQMVRRMVRRGMLLAPFVIVALAVAGGTEYAVSGAVGLAMTLGNLYLAARVIGGVAEKNPGMLLAAAMVAFTVGLALVTGLSFVLKTASLVYFPVTGFTLIGAHLVLVLWESAGTQRIGSKTRVQARET